MTEKKCSKLSFDLNLNAKQPNGDGFHGLTV